MKRAHIYAWLWLAVAALNLIADNDLGMWGCIACSTVWSAAGWVASDDRR